MKPACQSFREELHDPRERGVAPGHAEACAECSGYLARVERAAGRLADLERLAAPAQLDGMVVAALQTGVREERAARAVRELARESLPESLDSAVVRAAITAELGASLDRERAPSVLDRLVGEELSDPVKATVRRTVSSLPRERAPSELDARVHADLLETPGRVEAPSLGRRAIYLGASIAAGILAVLVLVPLTVPPRSAPERGLRPRSFRLEAATLEDLRLADPFVREAVASLGGGLLSAKEL